MASKKQPLPVSLNMLERDRRYAYVKPLVENGTIQTLADILGVVPKTTIANDLGKKVDRFNKLMARPEKFVLQELLKIQTLCDLNYDQIMRLVGNYLEYLKQNPPKLKNNPSSSTKKKAVDNKLSS
jgi:hypothetical protein